MKPKFEEDKLLVVMIVLCCMGLLVVVQIPNVVGAVESFGTFKQDSSISLIQTYNATYCNITSITAPDSSVIGSGILMTKNGFKFTHTLTRANTTQLGDYIVCGNCDANTWCADFEVTPTGFANTLGFYIMIFVISIIITAWGYHIEDTTVTSLGGVAFIGTGLYTWIEGIAGIRDSTITYTIAVVLIFCGLYIFVRSAMESLDK